jgi:hypothetical protein
MELCGAGAKMEMEILVMGLFQILGIQYKRSWAKQQ